MNRLYSFRSGFIPVLILIILGLVGGGTGVAVLADNAKPGDVLFPVDVFMEDIESLVKFNAEAKVDFLAKIESERIAEIEKLFEEKGATAPELDAAFLHVFEASAELDALWEKYPELRSRIDGSGDALVDQIEALVEKHKEFKGVFFESEIDDTGEEMDQDDEEDGFPLEEEFRIDAENALLNLKADFAGLQIQAAELSLTLPSEAVARYRNALAQAEAAVAQGRYFDFFESGDPLEEALDELESYLAEAQDQAEE